MIQENETPVTDWLFQARSGCPKALGRVALWLSQKLRWNVLKHVIKVPMVDRSPTHWVNEAFLKLLKAKSIDAAPNRRYLAVAAAKAVRETLVDYYRQRNAQKRGAGLYHHSLESLANVIERQQINVIELHDALNELARRFPRQAEVVDLRFFGGYTHPEIAQLQGMSLSTVEEDWRQARTWLYKQLVDDRCS